MPTIKSVENKIRKVEGFGVRFTYPKTLKDVRSDKDNVPQYEYVRASSNDTTMDAWRKRRFAQSYPGYGVEVLNGNGKVVTTGQTSLRNIRATYDGDD